jgi:hypothetical protein
LVGVLDVAGFAVDAILRIDHELRSARFLHPLINARRAITGRRACKYVVLGRFLKSRIGDVQVDGLILLVVGV